MRSSTPHRQIEIYPDSQKAFNKFAAEWRAKNGIFSNDNNNDKTAASVDAITTTPTTAQRSVATAAVATTSDRSDGILIITSPLAISRTLAKLFQRTNRKDCFLCKHSLANVRELAVLTAKHKRKGFYHKNCVNKIRKKEGREKKT
jgi:hypothetical protein